MTHTHNGTWQPVELGEIIDIYDSIRVPLNSRQRAERQGKYPYYGASGIIDSVDDYLFDGEYVLVAEDGENLNSRRLPVAFMARGEFWVNNHAHIIKGKKDIADDRFLIAWFGQADIKGYITGAAQPKLSQANLKRITLIAPPYPTQRKIASILSAYDDLIENNIRRIAILEAMAHAIYREWFVEFRFPGHEKVKLVESPLGKIPEGWKAGTLSDMSKVIPGYAFSSKDWQPTGIPVIKIKNIGTNNDIDTNDVDHVPDELLTPKLSKYILCNGDILIAMTGATAGKIGKLRSRHQMLLNQRVAKIDPSEEYRFFIWCEISKKDTQHEFFRLADGAAQPNMSGSQIESFKMIVPPSKVCKLFASLVDPILNLSDHGHFSIANLRKTRELLLPKLISGQLHVENLDIETEESLVESTA